MNSDFRLIILGDLFVGKTNIFDIFSNKIFPNLYNSTIGINFKSKNIEFNEKLYKINLWDISGNEIYRDISKSYCRGANGCILVFDLSDKNSFHNLQYWIEFIYYSCILNISVLLIGNKKDLKRAVSEKEAFEFSQEHNISYLETSCVNNYNINDLFIILCKDILNQKTLIFKKEETENIDMGNAGCFCLREKRGN